MAHWTIDREQVSDEEMVALASLVEALPESSPLRRFLADLHEALDSGEAQFRRVLVFT